MATMRPYDRDNQGRNMNASRIQQMRMQQRRGQNGHHYGQGQGHASAMQQPPQPQKKITLGYTPDTIEALRPARVIYERIKQGNMLNSLTYDRTGEYLLAADEENLHLYRAKAGLHTQVYANKHSGYGLARFTLAKLHLVHSMPRGRDNSIRYVDLNENMYIRQFVGHENALSSLESSPRNDTILSGSIDGTCRLWDLRTSICQAVYNLGTNQSSAVTCAYDPSGVSMAVASTNAAKNKLGVYMYDVRMQSGSQAYTTEPFSAATMQVAPGASLKNLRFSPTGKYISLTTTANQSYILDAYQVDKLHVLLSNSKINAPLDMDYFWDDAAWSPNDRYFLRATGSHSLAIWDVTGGTTTTTSADGIPIAEPIFDRDTGGGVYTVAVNPSVFQVATGASALTLWQPDRRLLNL